MAAIDAEQGRLTALLRPVMSDAYDTAKDVAKNDATAATALAPATAFNGAGAVARAANQHAQRVAEQDMSASDIAAQRIAQATARKQDLDARQAGRVARAAKAKKK